VPGPLAADFSVTGSTARTKGREPLPTPENVDSTDAPCSCGGRRDGGSAEAGEAGDCVGVLVAQVDVVD